MSYYQRRSSSLGLADLTEVDRYCYYVAGVVGELLTELFCLHCRKVGARRGELLELAPSFGEGLQLTNILKDFWEDRARGVCWLPRDILARYDVSVDCIRPDGRNPAFALALRYLVGIAHGHLRNAFRYTLTIPAHETGIRRFCLWAIGLAVLTLRRIDRNPHFQRGVDVKVSRRAVRATIMATSTVAHHDPILRTLFWTATLGLPSPTIEVGRPVVSVWHEPIEPETTGAAGSDHRRLRTQTLGTREP